MATRKDPVQEAPCNGTHLRNDLLIKVDPEKCTGCLNCMMRCALRHGKAFGPLWAKIRVVPVTEGTNEITFTDECDGCGICVRYCPHDAIYRGEGQTPAEGAN